MANFECRSYTDFCSTSLNSTSIIIIFLSDDENPNPGNMVTMVTKIAIYNFDWKKWTSIPIINGVTDGIHPWSELKLGFFLTVQKCDATSTYSFGPRTLFKRLFSCTLTGNGNRNQAF